MATRDAQDILDVKQTEGGKPKKKSQKPKLVRPAHIPKEVWLLETQGDRAPPVALTAVQPKKPKFARKVRPWEWQAFTNPSRVDGLVLHHWRKKPTESSSDAQGNGPATPAEGASADAEQEKDAFAGTQTDAHWSKYNVKVDVPRYTDEEYAVKLESDDWSKEETDYLIQLAEDFDLRWILIADRWDFRPAGSAATEDNAMAVVPVAKQRTMEDMKGRYYKVAAAMMEARMGMANMTPAEFNLHDKMSKYSPGKETRRKKMAEQLLQRTDEEVEEERRLLIELKRIIQEEDDFIRERTELFERLNAPSSKQSIAQFESSAGLMTLTQNLLLQDKARKNNAAMNQRRAIAGMDDSKDKASSPSVPNGQGARGGADGRKGLDNATGTERRKDSKAGHAHTPSFVQRTLTPREEQKYGVQRPDKLLTGEKIRHLRIEKRVTARASSVAAKVQDSMVELGIPIKPVMATGKIVAGYEELCTSLDTLLDYRRHSEKTENEIKVLKAQKDLKEGKEQPSEEAPTTNGAEPASVTNGETKSATEPDGVDAVSKKAERKQENQERHAEPEPEPEAEAEVEIEKEDEGDDDDDDDDDDDVINGEESDEEKQDEADDQDDLEEPDERDEGDEQGDADEPEDMDISIEDESDEDDNGRTLDNDTPLELGDDSDIEENDGFDMIAAGEDSRPSTRASGRSGGRKRSVSVLSSAPSQKSVKRQKK